MIEGGGSDFGKEDILNLKNLVNLWTSDEYDYGYRSIPQEFGKTLSTIFRYDAYPRTDTCGFRQ
jgi:hypothetical protein